MVQGAAAKAAALREEAAEEAVRIHAAAEREAARIHATANKEAIDAARRLDRRRKRLEGDLRDLYRERDAERKALEKQIAALQALSVAAPVRVPSVHRIAIALAAVALISAGAVFALTSSSNAKGGAPQAARTGNVKARLCPVPAQYRPSFVSAARQEGVPLSLLVAVATVESRFEATAQSAKGAAGLLQVLPSTAKGMQLSIGNPSANVHAGATYLRQMLDQFGSTQTALAAYNAGPNAVRLGDIPTATRTYVADVMSTWSAIQNCR
ncbi:MAG TPA: transglycosylase SLT domain-containing protein [Gaiellaceae bacterium]|nr:transglycosylase SLT domain-containing protein [Gaiellaceae bacterium]